MSFPSATSEPRICQVQFEEAQLSHRSAEPEKNEDQGEDRTEDEANLGKWNPSQFAPYMTGNFQSNHVQPDFPFILVRFCYMVLMINQVELVREFQS